jgi:hypothetical protein
MAIKVFTAVSVLKRQEYIYDMSTMWSVFSSEYAAAPYPVRRWSKYAAPPQPDSDQLQRMATTASTARWEEHKREPWLLPTRSSEQASVKQKVPNPASQVLASLPFPDKIEIPAKNLLPRPEDLPPMQQGNSTLAASLWMGGIVLCLLILVLLKGPWIRQRIHT